MTTFEEYFKHCLNIARKKQHITRSIKETRSQLENLDSDDTISRIALINQLQTLNEELKQL